ncbi:hypothetical protein [Bosea sp. Root670]|uniref:hypothetical protein n=1 Tax=Bosea sp. Root670 TaxID=1736583 RepID=UPI0012E3F243|nr:hypothetical protein [Bosea sp. Root670]
MLSALDSKGSATSLSFARVGVEAVRGSSAESRGLTMGIYTVFLDIAMAAGSPALGWIAGKAGIQAAFLVSAIVTFSAAGIALRLNRLPAA